MSNDSHDNENDSKVSSPSPLSSAFNHSGSSLGVDITPITFSSKQRKSKEKTEIRYGEEAAMDGITLAMYNVKKNADVCGDYLSPSFSMGVKQIKMDISISKDEALKLDSLRKLQKTTSISAKS